MKLRSGDSEVIGTSSLIFAGLALVIAMGALVTAGAAYKNSEDTKDQVHKLQAGGVIGSSVVVDLQEYAIKRTPAVVKAGLVTFTVKNVGGITHEMVVMRAASADALPKVTTAGERSVGAVDEEAVSAADTIGETGDVKPQGHSTKRFDLTPGTYVLFCNIDSKNADGTVTNHFQHGMSAVITVV